MKRLLVLALVLGVGIAGFFYARNLHTPGAPPVVVVPGAVEVPVLTYGFNHDAAERSFLRATELDPNCAMCWWGAALVLGPHVNAAMDAGNNDKAWSRLRKALALAVSGTPRERPDHVPPSELSDAATRCASELSVDRANDGLLLYILTNRLL